MRAFLVLAVATLMPAAAPAAPAQAQAVADETTTPSPTVACKGEIIAATGGKAIGIRPLGKEPSARPLLAVVRIIDGCNRPIAARALTGLKGR